MTIEEEARKIVNGERQSVYGAPENSFGAIAALWNGYFEARHGCANLDAEDVANLMILLKLARNMGGVKRDNLVDLVGYAICAARIQGIEQEARPREHEGAGEAVRLVSKWTNPSALHDEAGE